MSVLFADRKWHMQHCAAISATAELLFSSAETHRLTNWRAENNSLPVSPAAWLAKIIIILAHNLRITQFAISGPRVWNDLPLTLRASPGNTQTVSNRTEDNTVLFSLLDMIWCFRDSVGR